MANVFDQFDDSPTTQGEPSNVFDQFDTGERSFLEESGRQLLRTGRAAGSGALAIADLVNMPIDALLGATGTDFRFGSPSQAFKQSLDVATEGTPFSTAPEGGLEKVVDVASEFIAGAGPVGGLSKAAQAASLPKTAAATKSLAVKSAPELAALGAAGAGSEIAAQQFPDSPIAPLVGALAPSLAQGAAKTAMVPVRKFVTKPLRNQMNKAIFGRPSTEGAKAIKETAELAGETGVDFTVAQAAGTKKLEKLEHSLRVKAQTSDKFFDKSVEQVNKIKSFVDDTLTSISDEAVDSAEFGAKIKTTFDKSVDNLAKLRSKQGDIDFDVVKSLSGNNRVFPANNFKETLRSLVKEGSVKGATPNDMSDAKIASKLLSDFTKPATPSKTGIVTSAQARDIPLTSSEFQNQLKRFGKLAAGKGTVFKDMHIADSVRFAKRLFGSLQDDIDDVIKTQGEGSRVAGALRTARENYKTYSGEISALEDSILNKITKGTGRQPEDIANSFLKLKPSGVASSMKIIEKTDPDLVPQVQRFFIENALDKAVAPVGVFGNKIAKVTGFDANTFIKNLPDDKKMAVVFGGSKVKDKMASASKAINKILANTAEGSPTQPLQDIERTLLGNVTLKVVGVIERALANKSYNKIADLMLDSKNIKNLNTMAASKDVRLVEQAARNLLLTLDDENVTIQ